jgi:NTP pyrophosphatase (non-canonical NTP hydrolase)
VSDADHLRDANPWTPITEPLELKLLGKLSEELGECVAAISRCVIQGVDECEPVTGKRNREWLEDEIADVTAGIALATEHFELDNERIFRRVKRKMEYLRKWHAMESAT